MSEVSCFAEFTEKDRETMKKIIRRLISETNIVRDKDDVSRMYYLFAKRPSNLQAINNFLAEIGLMAVPDESGFIRLAENESNASRIKSGHVRLEKDVSQVLLALAWIYFEKEQMFTRSDIIIPIGELNITLEKFHFDKIIDSIKRADYIFRRLADFNLIRVIGKPGDAECKLCIYPSIKMSLSPTSIEAYVTKFDSEKGKNKEEIQNEEYEDEESEDVPADESAETDESDEELEGQMNISDYLEGKEDE